MKKVFAYLCISILIVVIPFLAYDYKNNQNPKSYYKVYLNNEVLGIIDSEKKLNKFIDKQSEYIKNKYSVDKVYAPEGLYIEELSSYQETLSSVEEIFDKIIEKETLTISGYQITIKKDEDEVIIYTLDENIFKNAVIELIKAFAGPEIYESYINGTQEEIKEVGSIIENIYIQNDITIKKAKISVDNKIYNDEQELSQFLLFGPDLVSKKYRIKVGDTIPKIAYEHEISPEEFLLSNPQFTDKSNLLHADQEVNIAVTNPQLKVVVEGYEVVDIETNYSVEERYNPDKYVGDDEVIQNGENGLMRVTQRVQSVNGSIVFINSIDRKEIKPAITKIVVKGKKPIPHVGDVNNWAWPSLPGYTLTDTFEWRINPITGKRERHSGIDIAGTGYGSPVYAANNGTIITKKYSNDYGYYITINHNNGYWTVYAHMSRFASNIEVGDTVSRGQNIGYVGNSGWSTGPHLHFELWKDCMHCRINPLSVYR